MNNGNCGQQKCAEVKIGNQVISECVCKEGFQSISIYDECAGYGFYHFIFLVSFLKI